MAMEQEALAPPSILKFFAILAQKTICRNKLFADGLPNYKRYETYEHVWFAVQLRPLHMHSHYDIPVPVPLACCGSLFITVSVCPGPRVRGGGATAVKENSRASLHITFSLHLTPGANDRKTCSTTLVRILPNTKLIAQYYKNH